MPLGGDEVRGYNAAMTTHTTPTTGAGSLPAPTDAATGLLIGLTEDDAVRISTAISGACTESTRAVYTSAWRQWTRWCTARGIAPLPGDPAALCSYLTELIYEAPAFYESLSPEEWPAIVGAHGKFVEQVSGLGGSLAGGDALAPPTAATTIRGAGTVTDGPFVETMETLNGYYVVEARDLDHAIEIPPSCARRPPPAVASRSARSWTRRRSIRSDRSQGRCDRVRHAGGRGRCLLSG